MEHGVNQPHGGQVTSAEVIRRIRAELGGPSERSSSFAVRMSELRRMQDEFRAEPVGGRLLFLKKTIYWFMASTVDRQAKVIDALFDAVDELAGEVEQQERLLTQLGQELAQALDSEHRLARGDRTDDGARP